MAFRQRLDAEHHRAVQQTVRDLAAQEGLSGLFLDHPEDVAYLTGFFHHPCERPVAVWLGVDGTTVLLVPRLEQEHAGWQRVCAELVVYPEYPGVVEPLSLLAPRVARGRVGVAPTTSVGRLELLQALLPATSFVTSRVTVTARSVKTAAEVALHAEAGRITDLMLEAGVGLVREALEGGGELPSEAELAAHVGSVGVRTMYDEHEDVVVTGFLAGGLVYSGPNSARPHGLPSGHRLRPGETFMLSLGCAVGGRFVEGERTFLLGEPSSDQVRLYEAVRAAHAEGLRSIRPGATCAEANAACLGVIRDAGLGGFLQHRQGHGIGLGMHEPPWLEDGDDTVIREGFVLSNEPGVYVPGHAGYRISDSVLVTADGARPFTTHPTSLDSIVIAA
ncbi:M24 family metallopeptidase [Phycicoccus duodecadis]|uniref:Xaa-Pro aminopeptidase n=1 Tax=Phycicoccus duodecadis TaxID=173053 RepID=A0A2N3YLZ0_9MICO|nr:Xaa-Pro peptidase family protein [Phycicoccus duodecadis]PKW27856.1 Xaa-Pro aminopeptidase [Phycicoccus duodecadis]